MHTRPLILGFAAALVLSAAARADEAPVAQKPAAPAAAKPADKKAAECPSSGTHIRQKAPNCTTAGPMRSYDQKDLQSTGETDVGEALKKLDPIFR